MPRFSLIIITKNRLTDLQTKLFPSLVAQKRPDGTTYGDFEVILWDAGNDGTSMLADEWAPRFTRIGACLRRFTAPRAGTAKQRNDALAYARGLYWAFFDDDSAVSPDGLWALQEGFERFPLTLGLSLRLTDSSGQVEQPSLSQKLFRPLPHGRLTHRRIKLLGGLALPHEIAGEAYTLPANAMALRREAFDLLKFDERLQHFSAYAFGEDRLFSAGLVKLTGQPFHILPQGWVWHRENPAPRARDQGNAGAVATQVFNRWLIWRCLTPLPHLLAPLFWVSCIFRWVKQVRKQGLRAGWQGLRMALAHIRQLKTVEPITLKGVWPS